MTTLFTPLFWMDAGERALKTFAQALLGTLAIGTPIFDLEWKGALGIAATAMLASLLTSVASIGAGIPGTASTTVAVEPLRERDAETPSEGFDTLSDYAADPVGPSVGNHTAH